MGHLFLLLDNAAKFTDEGTIKIGARFDGERLHCWIEDTGIGICPDDQEHIWEEFYQVDDQACAKYRGAGLGLTLLHDLLVLLHGESILRSEAGVGTAARSNGRPRAAEALGSQLQAIELPPARDPAAELPARAVQAPSARPSRARRSRPSSRSSATRRTLPQEALP